MKYPNPILPEISSSSSNRWSFLQTSLWARNQVAAQSFFKNSKPKILFEIYKTPKSPELSQSNPPPTAASANPKNTHTHTHTHTEKNTTTKLLSAIQAAATIKLLTNPEIRHTQMPIVIPKLSFPFKIPLTHYPIYVSLSTNSKTCAPSQVRSICPFYSYLFIILNSWFCCWPCLPRQGYCVWIHYRV